jgi:hypothetical protein
LAEKHEAEEEVQHQEIRTTRSDQLADKNLRRVERLTGLEEQCPFDATCVFSKQLLLLDGVGDRIATV